MKKFFLFILIFCSAIPSLLADEIQFTASAKEVVEVGERFQLVYKLNHEGRNFHGPGFDNFRYMGGPSTFSSTSTQIINGKASHTVTLTYTYHIKAIKEGEFTIEPATIIVDGKKYKSNEVNIKVIPASKQQTPTQSSQQSVQRRTPQKQDQSESQGFTRDDLFIRAFVNKSNPYQGEQVIVTYKIYTRVPVTPQAISKFPSFPGFWSKNLMGDNEISPQSREVYNGKEYITADIHKVALFPLKSGKLEFDPLEMQCVVQIEKQGRRNRFNDPFFDRFFDDPFFNRNIENVEMTIESNPLTVNVKPLPLKNKPANFSGAVGYFDMSTTVDKTQLKSNEAFTYKLTIRGKGNLEMIDDLNIIFPPDFEVYDPKITNNIATSSNGVSGSRIFEYLIIPRNAGDFTIDPVEFSYYDLSKNQYVTEKSPAYKIKVEKGEGDIANIAYSGINQEDIQYIGKDIRHIKGSPINLQHINVFFFNSLWFYILIIGPVIIIMLIIIIWKKREKKHQNIVLMKHKRATKVARRNLKKAREFLKDQDKDKFFIEISQALWGYLSNKFNIPKSKLSMDTVHQTLADKKVRKGTIEQFTKTLNNTEYARFAPGDSSSKMNEIYREALGIISKIEKELN